MPLEIRKPRRRPLSMTSLIDVIFLLLLFFMLTSTFSRFGEVELSGAARGGASAETPPLFLSVDASALRLNGEAVLLDELEAALIGRNERRLLVSLLGDVLSQRLVDVLAVLRGVDNLEVTVLQ
ncbi:biopolymer transporter ExbD [Roseovarius sp. M141]|uniref:ExbD/TolR family protein n=1 Tax=Roseovarius sp. M141 TaxID=2583806 RepID=UPI0020CD9789|nr:biopolymer transporter ExbD [Roseovarius sp. M141]MCQ0090602.1 biopolymer transporter ExbD [Roseovarius sp. M141]